MLTAVVQICLLCLPALLLPKLYARDWGSVRDRLAASEARDAVKDEEEDDLVSLVYREQRMADTL